MEWGSCVDDGEGRGIDIGCIPMTVEEAGVGGRGFESARGQGVKA